MREYQDAGDPRIPESVRSFPGLTPVSTGGHRAGKVRPGLIYAGCSHGGMEGGPRLLSQSWFG